jgi:60 kDa SS-A/Ro ribonucleoprotein
MTRYAQHASRKVTPQSEPIPGKPMVKNSAGGFTFALDDFGRLDRFLILGAEGGTYYATERTLTRENAACVERCWKDDPVRTADTIMDVSRNGRAPKNDPAIFALALGAASDHTPARTLALRALPAVCRTGTHLFQFIESVNQFRGWGPALVKAISRGFYMLPEVEKVAFQGMKYRQRGGWSQRDVLRKVHPKAKLGEENDRRAVFAWLAHPDKLDLASGTIDIAPRGAEAAEHWSVPAKLWAACRAMVCQDEKTLVDLIHSYRLPREVVPTEFLNSVEVWRALLPHMPPHALIRNLGKMTAIGLLKPFAPDVETVYAKLTDGDALRRARVHPLQVLVALRTYQQGRGDKGKLTWSPVPAISQALDAAFYLAFHAVVPTGKRRLLGLDVSGSMGSGAVAGSPLTPREATAALALVTCSTEKPTDVHVMGFSHQLIPLGISAGMRLHDAVAAISGIPLGMTDCALPMVWAERNRIEVDAFEVYTDNETWYGDIHPVQALAFYRRATNRPAKLVVNGMTATRFTVADPADAGMLDVVGFDTAAPAVMADFIRGGAPAALSEPAEE